MANPRVAKRLAGISSNLSPSHFRKSSKMRSFDASSSNNALRDASGLACVRFDHVQLLYNSALKFDATFSVLVFPLDGRQTLV